VPGATGATGVTGATGGGGAWGFQWQGTWAANVVYRPGDEVFDAENGSSYVALSVNYAADPLSDDGNWALVGVGGYDGVTGSTGATGATGAAGTAGLIGTSGITGPTGASFLGPWVPATTYQALDAVEEGGSTYIALQNNAGGSGSASDPVQSVASANGVWALLAAGTVGLSGPSGPAGAAGGMGPTGGQGPAGPPGILFTGAWSSTEAYVIGQVVSRNGSSYLATHDNSNVDPSGAGGDADWSLVAEQAIGGATGATGVVGPTNISTVTGATGPSGVSIYWQGAYSATGTYAVNDAVSENGSSYLATSATSEDPANSVAAADGVWNILAQGGAVGTAGITGPTGFDAPTGVTGATGAEGPTGPGTLSWTAGAVETAPGNPVDTLWTGLNVGIGAPSLFTVGAPLNIKPTYLDQSDQAAGSATPGGTANLYEIGEIFTAGGTAAGAANTLQWIEVDSLAGFAYADPVEFKVSDSNGNTLYDQTGIVLDGTTTPVFTIESPVTLTAGAVYSFSVLFDAEQAQLGTPLNVDLNGSYCGSSSACQSCMNASGGSRATCGTAFTAVPPGTSGAYPDSTCTSDAQCKSGVCNTAYDLCECSTSSQCAGACLTEDGLSLCSSTGPLSEDLLFKIYDSPSNGLVMLANGTVGINNPSPSSTDIVDVKGNVNCTSEMMTTSDRRLKKNFADIPDALEKLHSIQGVTYSRNDRPASDGRHIGVLAQDVQKVFPEAVSTDERGRLAVDYTSLTAPLIESIKTLKHEHDELRSRLDQLERDDAKH
jgi:hypothetical protein